MLNFHVWSVQSSDHMKRLSIVFLFLLFTSSVRAQAVTLAASNPDDGATDVLVSSVLSFRFSDALNVNTLKSIQLRHTLADYLLKRVLKCEPTALAAGVEAESLAKRGPAANAVGSENHHSDISKHVLS